MIKQFIAQNKITKTYEDIRDITVTFEFNYLTLYSIDRNTYIKHDIGTIDKPYRFNIISGDTVTPPSHPKSYEGYEPGNIRLAQRPPGDYIFNKMVYAPITLALDVNNTITLVIDPLITYYESYNASLTFYPVQLVINDKRYNAVMEFLPAQGYFQKSKLEITTVDSIKKILNNSVPVKPAVLNIVIENMSVGV